LTVKIISDIHGEYEALAGQLDPGDTAVLLGDYVNLIDFRTLDGILSEVYTREEILQVLGILARGADDETRQRIRDVADWSPEKYNRMRELIDESYRRFFASIPCRCCMIYGNTDDPVVMRRLATDGIELVECGVVEIEGQRFGLVSGSPRGPWTVGLPGEMDTEEYDRLVWSLGPVDVLCTHYPPAVEGITWDELANRDEAGSQALVEYIDRYSPTHHYFGHVHHPRLATALRGSTRLVNAGFFREHRTAVVHKTGSGLES
jgi:Icc-related predicted phosphoesterase